MDSETLSFFDKIKLLFWFIQGCHKKRFCISCKDRYPSLLEYYYSRGWEFCERGHQLPNLLHGMDEKSQKTANEFFSNVIISRMLKGKKIIFEPLPAIAYETFTKFEKKRKKLSKEYGIPLQDVCFEVFYSKMGIPTLPEKVREYMKNKVFLDCGAYIGDSVLMMLEFNPSKILAFDASPRNTEIFHKTMLKNKIPESKVKHFLTGLSDHEYVTSFEDGNNGGTTLQSKGKTEMHVDTLDHLCQGIDNIGYIKADIEGFGFKMAKGMVDILKRNRPVLSLAIYHNPEEFFEIKPFIESLGLNYKFCVTANRDFYFGEIYLQAYPMELE